MHTYLRHNESQIVRMACAESGMRKEEELGLIRRAKRGDKAAEDRLIKSALNLPRAFAEYRSRANKDFSYDELYAQGLYGLFMAYKKFNPKKNVRFATYAINWVKVYIDRHIQRQGATVHTHGSAGRNSNTYHFLSLNESMVGTEGDEDETTYQDRLVEERPGPEANVIGADTRTHLARILAEQKLSKVERDIIRHRYLQEDKILEELGTMNGVSRERVRQIELQLRKRLAKVLEREGYGDE